MTIHPQSNRPRLGVILALGLGLNLVSTAAIAQSLQINDLRLKSDIDWLNAQGVTQISTSTWPLTANEISRGLAAAKASSSATPAQQQVLQSLQSRLEQSVDSDGVTAAVELYGQSDRQALPQSFADDNLARQQATVKLGYSQPQWEANLQANLKNDDLIAAASKNEASSDSGSDVDFSCSYIAATAANQWLIAGQMPTWWGPGNDGSLIRGDASRPVVGVTVQRDQQTAPTSPYLAWAGPWQYQLFAGQLEDYQAIPNTKLIAMRLTMRPQPWLELGASRSIMWGGEGEPESARSLFDALTGIRDNGDTGRPDPANQLAGFDARLQLSPLLQVPASVYAQLVGEDEAGALPAKNMYLLGADYASAVKGRPYQLYAEYADTRTSGEVRGISYNHSIYRDGYYQQGYPLGHSLGGDAESLSMGGKLWLNQDNFIRAKLQFAEVNQSARATNKHYPDSDTLKAVDLAWERQLTPQALLSTRVWALDSVMHSNDIGAGIGLQWQGY